MVRRPGGPGRRAGADACCRRAARLAARRRRCRTPSRARSGDWLYEPDGAVIRAHLVADVAEQIGGRLIDPTIAYVTADELRATPYATAYAITDVLPFNVKKLKALLREREVGIAVDQEAGFGGRAGGAAQEAEARQGPQRPARSS